MTRYLNFALAGNIALAWLCMVLFSEIGLAQTDTQHSATEPKFYRPSKVPSVTKMEQNKLIEGIKVIAGREQIVFGNFNKPVIELHLPLIDNGYYAKVEFAKPKLLDANGNQIDFYMKPVSISSTENSLKSRIQLLNIPFRPEYYSAEGQGTIQYPIVMSEHKISSGETLDLNNLNASANDDEFVIFSNGGLPADAGDFIAGPVRGVHDSGGILRFIASTYGHSQLEKPEHLKSAYYGEMRYKYEPRPNHYLVDVAEEWIELGFEYKLALADVLPDPYQEGEAVEERPNNAPPLEDTYFKVTPLTDFQLSPSNQLAITLDSSLLSSFESRWHKRSVKSKDEAIQAIKSRGHTKPSASNFVMAAATDDFELVGYYLDAGFDINTKANGETPLTVAAATKKYYVLYFLLAAGADVNIPGSNNSTALHWVAKNCRAQQELAALIKKGADLSIKNKAGYTPVEMAQAVNCQKNSELFNKVQSIRNAQ